MEGKARKYACVNLMLEIWGIIVPHELKRIQQTLDLVSVCHLPQLKQNLQKVGSSKMRWWDYSAHVYIYICRVFVNTYLTIIFYINKGSMRILNSRFDQTLNNYYLLYTKGSFVNSKESKRLTNQDCIKHIIHN